MQRKNQKIQKVIQKSKMKEIKKILNQKKNNKKKML